MNAEGLMRAIVSLVVILAAAPAVADDATARAKALYQLGTKHYQVGEYRQALDAFKAGYLAKPNAAFLFNLGQCHRMLGELDEEVREYRAYLRESPNAPNRADVEGFIAGADAELARRQAEKAAASAKELA